MIQVDYRGRYLSTNHCDQTNIPQRYWHVRMFAWAVKSGAINGWCDVPLENGEDYRIRANNVGDARIIFGGWLLTRVAQSVFFPDFVLVPIPSTDAVVGADCAARSSVALEQSFTDNNRPAICDILRFTEKVEKASNGGPRQAHEIYPLLTLVGDVPDGPIVLVDDIATSGGHIRAAKRRLVEAGATVDLAVVCGHTVYDVASDPWVAGSFPLDDYT